MRPTSLAKDLILKFLQDLFSEKELYDGKNDFLWAPAIADSKILIADAYTEDLEQMEKRPAIVLRRGNTGWMNTSLGNRLAVSFQTGSRSYKDMIHTDLTAECLSRNGLEAEFLADLVFQGIRFFSLQIRQRGAFWIDSAAVGPETLIQSDSQQELTAVPVGMRLLFHQTWKITPSAETLRKIEYNLKNSLDKRELHTGEASVPKVEA
jgi:hypothetical protein